MSGVHCRFEDEKESLLIIFTYQFTLKYFLKGREGSRVDNFVVKRKENHLKNKQKGTVGKGISRNVRVELIVSGEILKKAYRYRYL